MGFFFKDEEKERDEKQHKALRRGTAPDPSASDYGKKLKAAVVDTGAMVNAGIRASAGTDNFGKAAEFRQKRDVLRSKKITQSMSPGGRSMAEGSAFPDENGRSAFLENPLEYLAFNAVGQVPNLAISAVPGGGAGRLAVAAGASLRTASAAATAATSVTSGSMVAADSLNTAFQQLDAMGEADWKKSKGYNFLRSKGLSHKQAAKESSDIITQGIAKQMFVLGLITGPLGAEMALTKALIPGTAKQGFIKGILTVGAKEAGQETVESSAQEFQRQASIDVGAKGGSYKPTQVATQGVEGGLIGFFLGGITGGITNIGGKHKEKLIDPKGIPVVESKAPDKAQGAAAQGAPLPPVQPVKTPPTVSSVPPGPPVVSSGAHTPPPGKPPAQKDSRKKSAKAGTGAPVVESSVIPDKAQVAALQTTVPPPPVQAPPQVIPPPPVTQSVTPRTVPLRAQQFLDQQAAPPPIATPEVTPPVDVATVQSEQQTTATPLPPPPVVPPAPQEVPTPRLNPIVLPDLAAQKEFLRKVEAPSQGTRYELGVDTAEVEDLPRHQAWRRKMVIEARGTSDPLSARDGDWRDVDITVTTDDGTTATVKAGPAIDFQTKRIKSLRELLDCVNAS